MCAMRNYHIYDDDDDRQCLFRSRIKCTNWSYTYYAVCRMLIEQCA
jgi:hypothetical protein